jgi:hypothetical protein
MENTGVLTIPYIIYIGVITTMVSTCISIVIRLISVGSTRILLFIDVLSMTNSLTVLALYFDTINHQHTFTSNNSNVSGPGSNVQFTTAALLIALSTIDLFRLRYESMAVSRGKEKGEANIQWML